MNQMLAALHSWLNDLAALLSGFPAEVESREQLINECRSNARLVGDMLHKYGAYYLAPLTELEPAWIAVGADGTSVHHEIENALSAMIKRTKT